MTMSGFQVHTSEKRCSAERCARQTKALGIHTETWEGPVADCTGWTKTSAPRLGKRRQEGTQETAKQLQIQTDATRIVVPAVVSAATSVAALTEQPPRQQLGSIVNGQP